MVMDSIIKIGSHSVGSSHPVFIIAEIGINHEGSVDACAKMIEAAVIAGADAVKLQTIDPDENYATDTPSYQLFSKARLSIEETARMASLSRSLGVEFFTTLGDLNTLVWVEKLGPAAYKISSGLLTHIPLIEELAKTRRTILISTGMSEDSEVDEAIQAVLRMKNDSIGLFQCTSLYPAPPETLNLRAIARMIEKYKVPVGFSDHSLGHDAASLAVASGSCMLEKHFSLDPSRPGFDHSISLDLSGFQKMVEKIRLTEIMLGDGEKKLSSAEKENALKFHRCLVAKRDIPNNVILSEDDIGIMRIANAEKGLPPSSFKSVLGKRIRFCITKHSPITQKDLL